MIEILPSLPGDLGEILEISRNVGVFSQEEVDTVDELFQGYLNDPVRSGYNYLSCRKDGRLAGFACWGPTALSRGTVDMYWICTDKAFQGQGIAGELFKTVEKNARQAGRWQLFRRGCGFRGSRFRRFLMEPKHPLHERHDPVMPFLLLGNCEVDGADGEL